MWLLSCTMQEKLNQRHSLDPKCNVEYQISLCAFIFIRLFYLCERYNVQFIFVGMGKVGVVDLFFCFSSSMVSVIGA